LTHGVQSFGYLKNGIKSCGTYWAIHITPEPELLKVSFETNLSQISMMTCLGRSRKSSSQENLWPPCLLIRILNVGQCFLHPKRLKVLNALIAKVLCPMITILLLLILLRSSNNGRVD
jgi:hypothetical protein